MILPLPATELESAGHAAHAATDTAATDVLYEPAPHSAQARGPAVTLYDPAKHAAHAPPLGPVYPGLQRQLVETVEPLVD